MVPRASNAGFNQTPCHGASVTNAILSTAAFTAFSVPRCVHHTKIASRHGTFGTELGNASSRSAYRVDTNLREFTIAVLAHSPGCQQWPPTPQPTPTAYPPSEHPSNSSSLPSRHSTTECPTFLGSSPSSRPSVYVGPRISSLPTAIDADRCDKTNSTTNSSRNLPSPRQRPPSVTR